MLRTFLIVLLLLVGMWGLHKYSEDPARMIGLIVLAVVLLYVVVSFAVPELATL